MIYEDALERCLQAARDGDRLDATLRRFPEHEARLRQDLALAGKIAAFSRALPPVEPGRAAAALTAVRAEVETQRRARSAPAKRGGFFSGFNAGMRGLVMAAAAVVLAIIAFTALGGSFDRNEALAATIEGIVVEKADGTLVVQTPDALESVQVDSKAEISDETGGVVPLSGIEVGQLVQIRGQRIAENRVLARLIARRAPDAIAGWCGGQLARCEQIERHQRRVVEQCAADAPLCERLRTHLQELSTQLRLLARIDGLLARCRDGQQPACRELRQLCSEHAPLCRRMQRTTPRD